jgi:hypothetical protein
MSALIEAWADKSTREASDAADVDGVAHDAREAAAEAIRHHDTLTQNAAGRRALALTDDEAKHLADRLAGGSLTPAEVADGVAEIAEYRVRPH